MKITFSVKNFEKFQHYKDRSPPWIKLYNEVLDDYAFGRLPDASKAHLLAIWLLASRYSNEIPYDPEWVGRRINATSPVDLKILTEAGFIVKNQSCSDLLAKCYQNARPETETETETETEESSLRSDSKPTTKKSRGSQIGDYSPSPLEIEKAKAYWLANGRSDMQPAEQVGQFRDYHKAHGAVMKDWPAAWRTWTRNAVRFTRQEHHGTSRAKQSARQGFLNAVRDFVAEPEAETDRDSVGETRLALPSGRVG